MKADEKIILRDSPEAATLVTMQLWKASNGQCFLDERTARYAGSTHNTCECGAIAPKHYTRCDSCRNKKDIEQYNKMPFKEWDGETPLVIYGTDTYFFEDYEFEQYCEDNGVEEKDLMLVICEPVFAHEIDGSYWEDYLPEDGELPDEIEQAIKEFNAKIRAYNKPLCWVQGKERTSCAQPQTASNNGSVQGEAPSTHS
jgi:hypothetical protein